jgi:ABC-2 type transport system permease protein
MRGPATSLLRLFALVGKELVEVVRRPSALFSLVLGPFLIMAVFGFGYNGVRRPLETAVVVPPGSGLANDVETYQQLAGGGLHIAEVVDDVATAQPGIDAGTTDVVVIAPADAEAQFRAGKRSTIELVINTVDPLAASYAAFLANGISNAVNQAIIRKAVQETEGFIVANGQPDAAMIPPDVVAAPTEAVIRNIAPTEPRVMSYYAPAVVALILQHLAVTLVALSLVRERTSGVLELFRVAPVNAWEILAGKVIAYLFVGGVIGAAIVALVVGAFGVPLLGDPVLLAGTIGLVLLASLGLGLAIAVVSDSERQAVQLSLLVLLASVFFSGFVLSVAEFNEPVRVVAYSLPVTHGIRLMQDIMLRGGTTQTWEYGALGLIALVTLTFSLLGLRRAMARA